jgi:HlyD family secretion protein
MAAPKKSRKKWFIFSAILIAIILVIVINKNKSEVTKVAIEAVANHTIIESVTATGKIYPETEVKISPEVSGEIIELNVEEGDSVSKGMLLVKINPAIYNSMVEQAEASLQQNQSTVNNTVQMSAQSKANFEQTAANYQRNLKLFQEKVISATEFEQIEAAYKANKASYEASQANIKGGNYGVKASAANLNQARENLLKTRIIAPSSGIVSSLSIKKGERVLGTSQMQGTQLLTIADMSKIEVRVDVSETEISKVKVGDSCIVNTEAYRNVKFKGVVSKIAISSVTTTTSTDQITNYTVHILLLPESYTNYKLSEKYPYPFKPGMSASVSIQTNKIAETLSIPVNAVNTRDWPDTAQQKDNIRQIVFVYNPSDENVSIRDVISGIQDNKYIQILSGLKVGEKVVTAPFGAIARTLNDKSKVKVVEKSQLFEVENKKD